MLESQILIPPSPWRAIPRARLTQALDENVIRCKLVLVSAPAGYGKTTLVAGWARATDLPVAWLSAAGEVNGVERFLRYLLAAWQVVQPGIIDTELGILLASRAPDIAAVTAAFLNAGAHTTGRLVFVVDDYQAIEDPAVHDALTFLLDHLPPQLHFILTTRSEPPLPLARYRARRQLLELGPGDLAFTPEESAAFLSDSAGLNVTPEEAAALCGGSEGWIAGLQLTVLGLHGRHGTRQALPRVSGRQRFIADYLAEDVLDRLPAEIQAFLLRTSILDRLSAPLCEAVTGRAGAQAMLETLERGNLFVVPLDDRREWYRYHALFAEFLQAELIKRLPGEAGGLHSRAARWFLDQGLPEPAFPHAIESGDVEPVLQILADYTTVKLVAGEIKLVQRWVDSLPEEWFITYPVVGLSRVGLYFFTGAFEAAVRSIDELEQTLANAAGQDARRQLARVKAIRCMIACSQRDLPQAVAYASQALGELPEGDRGFRPGVYAALGDTYREFGRWEEAKDYYLRALEHTNIPDGHVLSTHVYGALADLSLMQGRLRDAGAYWGEALTAIQDQSRWGTYALPAIGWVYIRMAEVQYERNQLAEAGEYAARGLERAELGGDVQARIAGNLVGARLGLAERDFNRAADYLARARSLVEQAAYPDWTSRFWRTQVEDWLAQDRLAAAAEWATQALGREGLAERPGYEVLQLAAARAFVAGGDAASIGQATSVLRGLIARAEEMGRKGLLIEALALQALAAWARGDQVGAMTSLERALRPAELEGYVRLWVDLGLPMARLLQQARSRGLMRDYVDGLLRAFGGPIAAPLGTALPEPLTPREGEILRLIAAGLTNREIAERLVISPETAKKHTGNIYAKLGAGSRIQAVARARELDLLD